MPPDSKKPLGKSVVGKTSAPTTGKVKAGSVPPEKSKWPAFTEKFGSTVRDAGIVPIPRVLLTGIAELGIKPIHAVILMQMIACWGQRSPHPFPRRKLLCSWLGCDKRTLDRAIADLVEMGLITKRLRTGKSRRQTSNEYDLTNLVERLKLLGRTAIKNKQRAAKIAEAFE